MLTNTWRTRLDRGATGLRRGALALGLGSCSVVAIATLWGWITDDPIDIAGPARSAVNRTALIGSYAQDCVTRWLTATQARQQALRDCWSLPDPIRLPTTPAVVVSTAAVSAVTLVSDTGAAQHWSAVVAVGERPFDAATVHTAYYRLPVLYSDYGVRASALPARVDGPGAGADAPLGYPSALADTCPVFAAVAGFLTSFLTGAGGLERWVTTDSGLAPAADYRSARLTRLAAERAAGDDVPPEGATLHVLATVSAVTSQFAPLQLDYPIVLTVTAGRAGVSGLHAELAGGDAGAVDGAFGRDVDGVAGADHDG
ncbi:conjugal transfer protein, partial [Mycobacterium simiae]|uniref:conjugal transfer protein n=1 Tax=Mycobacterium simiae TaxID=1784 RepID=UPI00165FA05E